MRKFGVILCNVYFEMDCSYSEREVLLVYTILYVSNAGLRSGGGGGSTYLTSMEVGSPGMLGQKENCKLL